METRTHLPLHGSGSIRAIGDTVLTVSAPCGTIAWLDRSASTGGLLEKSLRVERRASTLRSRPAQAWRVFGGRMAAKKQVGPWKLGQAYLIRGVTNYWTGRLEAVHEGFLVLADAAWIADTGRYNEAVSKGLLSEVEPVDGPAIIGSGAIMDACEWRFDLPRAVK